MPKYSKGKGKGKNGKGAKGNGKGDVEMGAAGYMGHDYWNYDYSEYSMYPSLFARETLEPSTSFPRIPPQT